MRKEYPGYDSGNHLCILSQNPGFYYYVQTAEYISDLCRNGNTDYNRIWNYFLYHMLPAVKEKICLTKHEFFCFEKIMSQPASNLHAVTFIFYNHLPIHHK